MAGFKQKEKKESEKIVYLNNVLGIIKQKNYNDISPLDQHLTTFSFWPSLLMKRLLESESVNKIEWWLGLGSQLSITCYSWGLSCFPWPGAGAWGAGEGAARRRPAVPGQGGCKRPARYWAHPQQQQRPRRSPPAQPQHPRSENRNPRPGKSHLLDIPVSHFS